MKDPTQLDPAMVRWLAHMDPPYLKLFSDRISPTDQYDSTGDESTDADKLTLLKQLFDLNVTNHEPTFGLKLMRFFTQDAFLDLLQPPLRKTVNVLMYIKLYVHYVTFHRGPFTKLLLTQDQLDDLLRATALSTLAEEYAYTLAAGALAYERETEREVHEDAVRKIAAASLACPPVWTLGGTPNEWFHLVQDPLYQVKVVDRCRTFFQDIRNDQIGFVQQYLIDDVLSFMSIVAGLAVVDDPCATTLLEEVTHREPADMTDALATWCIAACAMGSAQYSIPNVHTHFGLSSLDPALLFATLHRKLRGSCGSSMETSVNQHFKRCWSCFSPLTASVDVPPVARFCQKCSGPAQQYENKLRESEVSLL
jgi:hypothetical protein